MTLATDNSQLVLDKIKELPPLPLVVQKLLKVMEEPDSSAEDVSRVLASDQAMAAKILRLVNSSFYGLSGQVTTISRAVVILGMATIRNLALGLSVSSLMSNKDANEIQKRFWDHSLTTAAAAKTLANRIGSIDPEEAFIAGLTHNLGHLVFLLAVPTELKQIMEQDPPDFLAEEIELLGINHCKAGQKLFKQWKLPRSLEQVARFHHNESVITGKEDPLVSLVAMADILACVHGHRYQGFSSGENLKKLMAVNGVEWDQVGAILGEISQKVEETRQFLAVATEEKLEEIEEITPDPVEVVLIGTDQEITTWGQQILGHMGNKVTPMKQFFAQAGSGELPDLIILDPESITLEQIAKMKPVLDLMTGRVHILGDGSSSPVGKILGQDTKQIPIGFCHQDLLIQSD